CPSDAYNDVGNPWCTESDAMNYPGIAPINWTTGQPLLNWARGSYGAVEGGTDGDHTVNGQDGVNSAPYKGTSKRGMMGVNFGVRLAAVTDGLSNSIARRRCGPESRPRTGAGSGRWVSGAQAFAARPDPITPHRTLRTRHSAGRATAMMAAM